MPHVLIVDDDDRIRTLVSRYLTKNGFVTAEADCAASARAMLERFEFDVMVVDVMMPGETGLELTAWLRGRYDFPILLLTALGEATDRIAGFEQGADDYLPKPFEPRELVLRLHALLRRRPKQPEVIQRFSVGNWKYDHELGEIEDRVTGDKIRLTNVEVRLLTALAAKSGEAVSREDLARMCGLEAGERTIDVQVTRLRRKLGEDSRAPKYLQTARGKGYTLRTEKL